MHMLTVMIVGLAMGSTVMIGKFIGADKKEEASAAVGNTVVLFMGVAAVLTIGLLMLVHPVVRVMSTPQEAVSDTVRYLTICFMGIPFITAYNIISSIFRGMGDSKSPMYFSGLSVYWRYEPGSIRSGAWNCSFANDQCDYSSFGDPTQKDRDFHKKISFETMLRSNGTDFENWYSCGDSGWIYSDCFYCDHYYCKQERIK